jgi:dTDP-4-dehydrorhamnose 3,5-epimerase
MRLIPTDISGAYIVEPKVFGDARGFFMETWNAKVFADAGIHDRFVQSNLSRSARGVLRGLHYQWPDPQAKLVHVVEGAVFDVAVDIRVGSPSFGKVACVELSAQNRRSFYVPAGCAHGFLVLSEHASFSYLCSTLYQREWDRGIAWDDPDLAVPWPLPPLELSDKDRSTPRLRDVPSDALPTFSA